MGYDTNCMIYDKAVEILKSGSIDYKLLGFDVNNALTEKICDKDKRIIYLNRLLKIRDMEISRIKAQLKWGEEIHIENYKLSEEVSVLRKRLENNE